MQENFPVAGELYHTDVTTRVKTLFAETIGIFRKIVVQLQVNIIYTITILL